MNHFYQNIPGWFAFHDVYDRAVCLLGKDGAHFVEVGCWEGKSAAYMGVAIVNSGRKIRFDCVDTWEGSVEHVDKAESAAIFGKFRSNMSIFDHLADIRTVRKESTLAAKDYPDNSLDFVFLDASHDAESVEADIRAWGPKVKERGVLAGDDVGFDTVREGLIAAAVGIPENPVVPSDGDHKSWILAPGDMQKAWATRIPKHADIAKIGGGVS